METLRPISGLSSYVLDELPNFLLECESAHMGPGNLFRLRESFMSKISSFHSSASLRDLMEEMYRDKLVGGRPLIGWQGRYSFIDLALMDLKFLDAAFFHLFGDRCEFLYKIIDDFSFRLGRQSILTYEELVLINPMDHNMRKFSVGVRGENEHLFYEQHHLIEDILDPVIEDLHEILKRARENGFDKGDEEKIGSCIGLIAKTFKNVGKLHKDMDKAEFAKFRLYLMSYYNPSDPRHLSGPSGAFAASIPTIELLLGGDKSDKDFLQWLIRREEYYPVTQRALMTKLITESAEPSLLTLAQESGSQDLYRSVKGAADKLKSFRMVHLSAVDHHLDLDAVGTGGSQDTRAFLKRRINDTPSD